MGWIKTSEKKSCDFSPFVTTVLCSHPLLLFASFTMEAISSADKANVIFLLLSDHSIRKVGYLQA
jgi:hypothetical protein